MSAVPVSVARLVDARDKFACVRCGASLMSVAGSRHHRQRRRDGGHTTENLVLLCGSGTTLCHGWVHAHPEQARAEGLIVPALGRATSDVIPVRTVRGWLVLDAHGGEQRIPEAEAAELLAVFGLAGSGVKERLTANER